MPEGGDQVPSDFLAIRMPEPPDPVIHRPLRMQVKTAMAAAFCIIRFGIRWGIFIGLVGPFDVGDEGASLWMGAR